MLCPLTIWEIQARLLALYLATTTKIRTVMSQSSHRFIGMRKLPAVLVPRVVRLMQIRRLSFKANEPQSLRWEPRRYLEHAQEKACSNADGKHLRLANDTVKKMYCWVSRWR